MLEVRILSALILIPLVIWAVLALPAPGFAAASGLLLLAAAWEWTRLVPLAGLPTRLAFLAVLGLLLGVLYPLLDQPAVSRAIASGALLWWLLAGIWLRWPHWGQERAGLKAVLALPVLVPAWVALNLLQGQGGTGPQLLLFILVLMWVTDSAAYFTGRALGRHKLAPRVSPGKTWEGVAGGLAASGLAGALAALWFGWDGPVLAGFVLLALACSALSVVGDLFISLLKRQAGLKDSGQLIPGHGGVLDRIDSLLAAAPLFAFGIQMMGVA
ncbi:phosphatidate cytidylyltransferase [Thiohalobacter sp. IOR34]|uniref:phosphatidate cytidylyltransferase n=1 Tax=Thiohalobacter sp. IOR34 TaxID=3057176 RepID=UPI0025AF891B|nr:phosphatidate cytidylyltransferase [Thiohalobacter sp. IOR34]WJW76579.1 phosphatidate cytidylyltransferase [Thiohalobacter sp. IOR34]